MNYRLFDDQKQWCRKTVDAFEKGVGSEGPFRRVISTAATGAGKSIMAAAISEYALKRWTGPSGQPSRVLFLADTDELVQQGIDKFHDAAGLIGDREKAQDRASLQSRLVVGSIQTLSRPHRLDRFPDDHFALVVADECHLSMADSWMRVLERFHGGGARTLGITATPERHDGINLFDWWEHCAAQVGIFELIELGRLAPITVETVPIELDCGGVKRQGASYDEQQLTHAIEPAFEAIIDAWLERAQGRKTLWFLPGIAASRNFRDRLLRRGLAADHIDGTSPDRREILEGFRVDRTQHLCNAQLLGKGYDQPDIGCVVILRPTRSRVAYQQMVGRGTRVAPGKRDLLLLDFLWQFDDLGIQRPADLVATTKQDREEVQAEIERQGTLQLTDARDLTDDVRVKSLVEQLLDNSGRRRRRYDAREAVAILRQPELLRYEPDAAWENLPPTDRQLEALARDGISRRGIKTRGFASQLLQMLIDRRQDGKTSLKQAIHLARHGVENPEAVGREEAKGMLDRIFASEKK